MVDIPDTVPFSVKVNAPIVKVLFPPLNERLPLIVGLPVKEKALAEAALKSRLPKVAPEIVFPTPVILIFPMPVLMCVPVPAILPEQVTTFPLSASVPVSVRVVPTLRLLPNVVVPALAVNKAKLFDVPAVL